jgi:Predicted polymerase, most proteins contain PALM domain, HD hydrolase domain and Zn-ribbon domain
MGNNVIKGDGYMQLFNNEFIDILSENKQIYIRVKKTGFSISALMDILHKYPDAVYDYPVIANAMLKPSNDNKIKIGNIIEKIEIDISNDSMYATVRFNVPAMELSMDKRETLVRETALKLNEKGIVFGIKNDIFLNESVSGKEYIIAEGTLPEDGKDSIVRYYELKEVKPEVIEDEKFDYYNMSLIPSVEADTWLGERIEAVSGIDGYTVKSEAIKAKKGITYPLYYDKEYVYEKHEENKTVLYSKVYGAVYFKGLNISLMNPLIIDGDVAFKTGNIHFDGHVIIKGTICDGFYVEATDNIEVNGELGLGNIKGIVSKNGSIFVKGGLLCKGNVTLKAAKNVYVKFIENASIECGGTAHIGFYSANSNIKAKDVIVDSLNGKIVGGSIKAVTRIVAPVIGSELGKKTVIELECFDRDAVKAKIDALLDRIEFIKNDYSQVKQQISAYSSKVSLTPVQDKIYASSREKMKSILEDLKKLNEEKEGFNYFYKTRGDGEINITKRAYSNTIICMKNKTMELTSSIYSTSFVFQGGRIIEI